MMDPRTDDDRFPPGLAPPLGRGAGGDRLDAPLGVGPGPRRAAQARHAGDPARRDPRPRLPGRRAGRRRGVDHRRRAGLPRGDDRAGRYGLPGARQLADARQVFADGPGGGRIPRPLLDADRPDRRRRAGQRDADARARLRADVPGVGLRDDHQGLAPPRGGRGRPQGRQPDQPGPERRGRVDLHPGLGRRGVRHRDAGPGPPRRAERRLQRRELGDPGGGQLPGEVQDPRGRHPVLARRPERPQAADLRGGRGHALQRRPVRQPDRRRLPQVRLGPVPRQRRLEQGERPRLLHPPVRLAGVLHGRRTPTGTSISPRPATSSSPCRRPTGRGTATASAPSTARASA